MKITALLDVLNSALAETVCVGVESRQPTLFAGVYGDLRGGGYRGSYRPEEYPPGAEHGSAAWGDVFRAE